MERYADGFCLYKDLDWRCTLGSLGWPQRPLKREWTGKDGAEKTLKRKLHLWPGHEVSIPFLKKLSAIVFWCMCVDGFRCTGWSSHLASQVFLDLMEERCTQALNELIMQNCFIIAHSFHVWHRTYYHLWKTLKVKTNIIWTFRIII